MPIGTERESSVPACPMRAIVVAPAPISITTAPDGGTMVRTALPKAAGTATTPTNSRSRRSANVRRFWKTASSVAATASETVTFAPVKPTAWVTLSASTMIENRAALTTRRSVTSPRSSLMYSRALANAADRAKPIASANSSRVMGAEGEGRITVPSPSATTVWAPGTASIARLGIVPARSSASRRARSTEVNSSPGSTSIAVVTGVGATPTPKTRT